jgi:hypothetical protein
MRVVTYLPDLKRRHVHRMGKLLDSVYSVAPLTWPERDRLIGLCAIEAVNTFERYCRFLYLSSALGGKDESGNAVLPPAKRCSDVVEALTLAVETVYPTRVGKGPFGVRSEPDWKNAGHLLKVFAELDSANRVRVEKALSLQTRAIIDLPVFRNFYAHRGQGTARLALDAGKRMAIVRPHPTDVLSEVPSIDHLITEWIFDLQVVVDLMA